MVNRVSRFFAGCCCCSAPYGAILQVIVYLGCVLSWFSIMDNWSQVGPFEPIRNTNNNNDTVGVYVVNFDCRDNQAIELPSINETWSLSTLEEWVRFIDFDQTVYPLHFATGCKFITIADSLNGSGWPSLNHYIIYTMITWLVVLPILILSCCGHEFLIWDKAPDHNIDEGDVRCCLINLPQAIVLLFVFVVNICMLAFSDRLWGNSDANICMMQKCSNVNTDHNHSRYNCETLPYSNFFAHDQVGIDEFVMTNYSMRYVQEILTQCQGLGLTLNGNDVDYSSDGSYNYDYDNVTFSLSFKLTTRVDAASAINDAFRNPIFYWIAIAVLSQLIVYGSINLYYQYCYLNVLRSHQYTSQSDLVRHTNSKCGKLQLAVYFRCCRHCRRCLLMLIDAANSDAVEYECDGATTQFGRGMHTRFLARQRLETRRLNNELARPQQPQELQPQPQKITTNKTIKHKN